MRGTKVLVGLLASAAAFTSVQANAATITYTLSGAFSGRLNADPVVDFNGAFTGIGDTDNVAQTGRDGELVVPLSSLTFDFGGETYTLLGQNAFFLNSIVEVGGFRDATDFGAEKTAFYSPSFASYDGISNIAGVTGVNANGPFVSYRFITDKGQIELNTVTDISFSASVAAVPEPATWAMMLIGFGMIGGASRYGRKRTAVAYA